MSKSPLDVIKFIKDEAIELIDLKFTDLYGKWQHLTVCSDLIEESSFNEGLAFDGSSIRGWKSINDSDMAMVPDSNTAWVDPFYRHKTLSIICSIQEPRTNEPYSRCPRTIGKKALNYLISTDLADKAYFGPEPEFFVFEDVRYHSSSSSGFYSIDSIESPWNTARLEEGGNLANKIQLKQGYFPVSPNDTLQDIRSEMLLTLGSLGVQIEKQHHEVATSQHELGIKFAELITAADNVMIYKYVVRNIAKKYRKTATFMPKPVFNDNGSGMHVHQSLWKADQPLFFGEGTYANLSQTARWYIGGLLKHAPSFAAFTNPSTNSYKRLVPGFEAPVNLVYSQGNRSAAVRIPLTGLNPKAKRLEFRSSDALANPYLAFSAMLMAGIDGIKNQIEPGQGYDMDLFELSSEELSKISTLPFSLDGALKALKLDKEYLIEGDVFTEDFIDNWIALKYEEVQQLRQRPHPHEFSMYFDA
uniref:Glutamine synthetase n=1 Tax=Paulinella chromatophora TaxID=39717 RepID=B1X428_PAUCH|nr:Glutamine synthetase, glutamate--ammonia ligase [Paulinella chromatophora]ACB42697.1 Glutamine synthetase, glutamate--ammonia ligase [Paulinella chromatophora]|eukprot:gb/GEZN01005133.1/.p1 GENE.gb/GEZN01005133.1/~~gb/GEZN01005133.1/.p1  ORF type:complete len:473 (-),score=1.45 gb/GEZN01005133.1/:87-1505(-)